MDFERDYFMRQIKNMTRGLANLLFDKDIPEVKIIEDDFNISSEGLLYLQLKHMISEKKINEAENILFEEIADKASIKMFYVALQFYNDLYELSDEYLGECHFSREEILDGIEEVKKIFMEEGIELDEN